MNIKIIAAAIAIIFTILFCLTLLTDGGNHFNAKKIFREYCKLFERNKGKIILIYTILLVLSISLAIAKNIGSDIIDTITLIISILCGAFLAFLPVVLSLKDKQISSEKEHIYQEVCDETNTVLIFELLFSVIELIFCFVYLFISPIAVDSNLLLTIILTAVSAIIYYLVFIILLNIMLVLKRISAIIRFLSEHSANNQ